MKFRSVQILSDAGLQALMATYTYGEQPALRRRAHAIVHGTGGVLGVGGVIFTPAAPASTIRPIVFEHLDARLLKMTSKSCAICSGALNPGAQERAE
ncbi:hypothetical protein SAMN05661010_02146 [Modicisalibacter muralis]|uniref:Uncharacterized protein n=1 Tax=Modicisalibacter muralis TaxID=119000 RepID=A0A1G9LLF4_9GAMM|nr:hypothetical protein [Halomonas muralis]SDL62791.1 hypothetical protein SAMN05661010_02146 [Halomonas muralis]